MALNMGLHSAFLYTLCSYQNKNFTSLRNTRRFYIAAFTIFGVISLVETINAVLALAFYNAHTWQMGFWFVVVFSRTAIEGGTAYAFSTIEMRIPKVNMEDPSSRELSQQSSTSNKNEDEDEYMNSSGSASEQLLRKRDDSGRHIEETTECDSSFGENQNIADGVPFLVRVCSFHNKLFNFVLI